MNTNLAEGDPVLEKTETITQALPGPFAGLSMNCRACHLIKEQMSLGRGIRAYTDFARRSPIPIREDGKTRTVRNAPAMVNALIVRTGETFLHLDGEFANGPDLVKGTFTGRNFGWLPGEQKQAIRHIARVIREDDGKGLLAAEFGGYPYRTVFKSSEGAVSEEYEVVDEYRLDVTTASDEQVFGALAKALDAYMTSLFFSRNSQVEYDGSPYDVFLEKNEVPRKIVFGQEPSYYSRNVLSVVTNIPAIRFVSPADNCYRLLKMEFRFNKAELEGMKIFFTRSGPGKRGIGNCIACHTPPDFTDFQFHNTGVSQEEYEVVHGKGAFSKLVIPGLAVRNRSFDKFLPANLQHPRANGPFLDIPDAAHPERADLGLWNVFGNPAQPSVQKTLRETLDPERKQSDEQLLEKTIGCFKTPGLRGLAMSAPYMHNGSRDTVEDVIRFYIKASRQARAGEIRNADPELGKIFVTDDDIEFLAAFLKALNEDYE
ncbi:MAG TPA: hypothetical protein VMZ27_07830 [Candidatus Saccharimonadales bacterium]|nr:hypothetical protein [Candidatus Saccharimonadales bacterium]